MKFPKLKLFRPQHPEKYVGDVNKIIARSNLEMKYFYRCDTSLNILEWGSENIVVPYLQLDNSRHRYYVDLYLKVKDKNGNVQEYIAEIKPDKFTKTPRLPKSKRRTKGYLFECKNWIVNTQKWKYATEYAKERNWKFIMLTEKNI